MARTPEQPLFTSALAAIDDDSAKRFHQLCKTCGITSELEEALLHLGYGSIQSVARMRGSREYDSFLGLLSDMAPDEIRSCQAKDDERGYIRSFHDRCRQVEGLPLSQSTRVPDTTATLTTTSANSNPNKTISSAGLPVFQQSLHDITVSCGIDERLERELMLAGYDSVGLIAKLSVAEFNAFLRLQCIREDSAEKEKLTQLHTRCRWEASLPKNNRVILHHAPSEVTSDFESLQQRPIRENFHDIGHACGVSPGVMSFVSNSYASNAVALARLDLLKDFERLLQQRFDFGDGKSFRKLYSFEQEELIRLYEACRILSDSACEANPENDVASDELMHMVLNAAKDRTLNDRSIAANDKTKLKAEKTGAMQRMTWILLRWCYRAEMQRGEGKATPSTEEITIRRMARALLEKCGLTMKVKTITPREKPAFDFAALKKDLDKRAATPPKTRIVKANALEKLILDDAVDVLRANRELRRCIGDMTQKSGLDSPRMSPRMKSSFDNLET